MADNWEPVSLENTTAALSPGSVGEVTRFGIRTHPSQILVYINNPTPNLTFAQARVSLDALALLVETAARHPGFLDAFPAQQLDDTQLLQDYLVITVGVEGPDVSGKGPFTQEVWQPVVNFTNDVGYAHTVGPALDAAYQFVQQMVNA